MKLTNKGKALMWSITAVLVYSIPLIILALTHTDKIFKSASTTLTFFSIVIIVLFVIFAKKAVKAICKVTTGLVFASLVGLVLAIGLRSLADDLILIFAVSLFGAVLAWLPLQLTGIYNGLSKNADGTPNTANGISVIEAIKMQFAFIAKN